MSKPTTGRLAITAWRNDDYFEYPLRIIGLDARALGLKMEIRRAGDTGGAPRVRLDGVEPTEHVKQGLRVAGVSIVDGVEVSDVRIRMDRGTLQSLGYQGARGDAATFEYALLIGGRTRLTGAFVLPPHAFGSDAAPLTRPESYGLDQALGLPNGGATLTISADGGATVLMDGADLVSASIIRAEDAAEQTAADRDTVEGIASTSYQAVPTYAAREAIPLAKRQNGMRVQVMEGTPRVFEWRTDLYMPGAWVGQYTPAEIKNLGIDFTGELPAANVEGLTDAQDAIDSIAAIDIAGFRATALSGDANPKVELAWEVKGTPTAQTISWGSSTIAIAAAARTFTPKDWAAVKPIFVVGNSLSTSTDTTNRWSQLLAADRKQPLYSVARYTSDWSQVYRSGAAPLYLTIAGGALPAGGTAAAVTLINGAAPTASPSANPASFLNTGDGGLTTGVSMAGTIVAGATARHVTVSIPNAASTAYSIVQDAGAAALPLSGPVLFIPDIAKQIETSDLILWTGNNYYYSGVGNAYGDYTNPQMWVDMARIVAAAAGNRVLILPILPAADEPADGTPNPNVPGETYHLRSARAAANARTEALFPTAIARDAQGRSLLKRLQDSGNGSANDNADVAAGLTPRSLRADALHLNAAGDAVVFAFVKEALARQALPSLVTQGTVFTLTAMGLNPRTGVEVRDTAYAVVRGGEIAALLDPLRASVDGVVSQAAYRPTLAAAVADFEVGTFFTSRDMDGVSAYPGEKRQYEIIAQAPYWADRGPFVGKGDVGLDAVENISPDEMPVSSAQAAAIAASTEAFGASLASEEGADAIGMPGGGTVDSLDLPLRRIKALGLAQDAVTDHSDALASLFATAPGQHIIPVNYDLVARTGGYRIGAKTIRVPRFVGLTGQGRVTQLRVSPDTPVSVLFAINTDGAGKWVQSYPGVMNVEYKDMYVIGTDAAAAGKYPTVFEIGASAKFQNIVATGVVQLTNQIKEYLDQISVERVTVTQEEDGSGRYANDLGWAGDGCVADQVHMSLKYGVQGDWTTYLRGRNVRFAFKVGSRITESLNGDHELSACDGITTSGWHMEFGQARLIGSSATLTNHNFWKHDSNAPKLNAAPIYIGGITGIDNIAPGIVSIADTGIVLQQGFHGYTGAETLPDLQIDAGWRGHLHVERLYRKHRMNGLTPALGSKFGVKASLPVFNTYSHLASVKCDLLQTELRITDTLPQWPATAGVPSTPGIDPTSPVQPDFGTWDLPSGAYRFAVAYIYDVPRKIGLPGTREQTFNVTNGLGAPLIFMPDALRCVVRVYMGMPADAPGTYSKSVDVPLISGGRISVFGSNVMGFAWNDRPAGPMDTFYTPSLISYAIEPGEVSATSDAYGRCALRVRSNSAMPATGSWRRGDEVRLVSPLGNRYLQFFGWRRASDGAGHVLGTDWVEIFEQHQPLAASTAELSNAANAWNLAPLKRVGLSVFNVTLNKPLWAASGAATGTWLDATGAAVINPA